MAPDTGKQTDTEKGNTTQDVPDDQPELPQSARNQPPSSQSPEGGSNFGDSSGPIFSMYSKITKEEDDQVAERWQKDADGILIFTGLFSAAVAALLAVSVQDLRQSSQDTSAFYLGNIYQVLADPNAAAVSTPVAQPPPFSPPRDAVWVNSLWSLSLVISLICALLATSLQQWARRFIRVTQPKQCSPEKRARMRAFFSGGADKMHLPWAVEALPFLIHVSLFLFFSGLIIFMRSINHSVYLSLISAIGLFAAVYVSFTCMPIFWPDSPYNTPLSLVAFFVLKAISHSVIFALFLGFIIAEWIVAIVVILLAIVVILLVICLVPVLVIISVCVAIGGSCLRLVCGAHRFRDLSKFERVVARQPLQRRSQVTVIANRFAGRISSRVVRIALYQKWVPNYSRNAAENLASKRSPKIDLGILNWTIGALGDDDTLEKFFEDVPGFFHSQTVRGLKKPFPYAFLSRFSDSWGGFLARTLSSNSVDETVRTRRLEICMKAIKEICDDGGPDEIFCHLSSLRFDQVPPSIHTVEILSPWCANSDRNISELAKYTVAKMLPYVRERDGHWVASAQDVFGLPEHFLRDHIAHGDNSVLLLILICAARQVISTEPWKWEMLSSISKFDILNTPPELKNHFCSLWNEIIEEANDREHHRDHLKVLRGIRHLYIALHQDTESAPIVFDASTPSDDFTLSTLSSYPSCSISIHRLDPTVPPLPRLGGPHTPSLLPPLSERQPTPGGSTVPQQVMEAIGITHSPLHSQKFSSPDPNAVPEHIVSQANPAALPSIHESIETVTLDVNRLVITEVSHFSHQSSPYAAALTANIVRSHDPTTDVPIDRLGQTSQIPAPTFHTHPHSDSVAVTVTPSTVPCAPDDDTEQQGIPTPQSASATTQILSTANQISQFIPSIGATPQTGDKPTGAPPTPDSGSLSSPTIMPVFHSGTIHEEFHSSVESALAEHDNIQHPLGSHLTTAASDISPQITSVLDAHATVSSSLSIPRTPSNARDITHSISMEVSGHENPTVPPTPNIAEHTSAFGDHQGD